MSGDLLQLFEGGAREAVVAHLLPRLPLKSIAALMYACLNTADIASACAELSQACAQVHVPGHTALRALCTFRGPHQCSHRRASELEAAQCASEQRAAAEPRLPASC